MLKNTELMNILLKELPEQGKEFGDGSLPLGEFFTAENINSPVGLFRTLCIKHMSRITLSRMTGDLCPIGECLGAENGCQGVNCLTCWEVYLEEKYHLKEVNLREELKEYR